MKFGIFYEHQLPRPWSQESEYRLLHESLAQIELADGLGYDYAWEVEHHVLEEYSHSSAPEVFLGAASQRTRRIRLGHGVIQLPTNHPIRVAERVSTLDLLSGGRVELGLGQVLDGRVSLEKLDTSAHTVYAHQNENIVRLTPEELKRKMAAKEAAAGRASGGAGDA